LSAQNDRYNGRYAIKWRSTDNGERKASVFQFTKSLVSKASYVGGSFGLILGMPWVVLKGLEVDERGFLGLARAKEGLLRK
jgi:hypothetical protein